MASPQLGFCGLGSRLGSNEKVEMTLSASKRVRQRPLGIICVFPLALFDVRRPRAFRGPAFEPWSVGLLILSREARALEPYGAR